MGDTFKNARQRPLGCFKSKSSTVTKTYKVVQQGNSHLINITRPTVQHQVVWFTVFVTELDDWKT